MTETMNDFIAEHWSNILHIRSSQDKRTDGVEEIVIPDLTRDLWLHGTRRIEESCLFVQHRYASGVQATAKLCRTC